MKKNKFEALQNKYCFINVLNKAVMPSMYSMLI